MLYIFNPNEKLIALLKPDFTRSTGPATTSRAFSGAEYPAEFDREPTEGCPYWDAVHREVLNGENTLAFTVPADRADAAHVQESNLVAFRDLDSYWQLFEIKRVVDLHGDGLTRTAFCEHIFYELLDDIVTDKRPSADATAALAGMLENTRWQVGVVDDLGASSTSAYYISALEAVQKVAEAWQGELNWRCVINGGVITRYVDLLAMRGTDTGKQFAYSKDVLNIEREVDTSGVVTALYGRGKGIELDSGSYGRRLTFADVVAADKPAGQEWIGDTEALARWGRPGGRHRFGVFVDEEETDPAVLLQKTRDELDRRKVPRVTYRLDVVNLEELTGYEHEAIRLGDMVRVIDREFKPELVVSARVIDIERDLLDPANTKVVLGSFAPTIVEATINTARRVNEMANKPYNTKWLDGKISVLQNAIENTQSYVFQTADDGILILDAADYATATKAMKLGGGIFAIANQKDGLGGWNWRTFGDGSGFSADLITAGLLDAARVKVGVETTFEEGYDPSKNKAIGMGADAYCTGLWHFDGSLNSHKGVAAIFLGDFVASKWGQGLNIVKQPLGDDFAATEDTTDEFAAGTLVNVEAVDDKLQLVVAPPVYGEDFTAGKTYTASSTYSGSYPASKAFDDTLSTYWRSASTGFPYWVDVDLGAAVTAIARKLRVYCELGLYMPENFILQGSNNASDWTDIYSGEIRFDEVWEEFEFSNSNAYRYYRLYCVDGPSAHVRINEIELMEIESEGYASLGTREQEYDLSAVNIASDSVITWVANTPTNTSVAVQAAIAPDGVNYGSYQECVSGQSIPGIAPGMDVSKAKLKIKAILATIDSSVTPTVSSINLSVNSAFGGVFKIPTEGHLHPEESSINMRVYNLADSPNGAVLLDIVDDIGNPAILCGIATDGRLYIEDNAANKAYGLNKSGLVTWDAIAIQWKPERLSLIVNGEETAYIENPGQASSLGEYTYIGVDREETTWSDTVIDELRIDCIYQPLEKVKAWYLVDAPFYTTEEFKQWPGYVQVETDGLKVYDSMQQLRVLVGSWVRDAIRKYGIKIIEGELYAGYLKTAGEFDDSLYVEIGQTDNRGYINLIGENGARSMRLQTDGNQSAVQWYDGAGERIAKIYPNGTTSFEMLFSSDTGITLSSYTGEKITMGPYQDKTAARGIQLTRVSADIIPYTDDVYYIGEPGRRWSDIYAHFVHTGDLCFEERSCPICGGLFAPGEVLTLLVTAIDGSTYTIPIHDRCKGLPAEIEVAVPELETQYTLNERGETVPVRRAAMEEYEEEIITVHPDYVFDNKTGKFFRKADSEENVRMFGAEALSKGVEVSKSAALATDTVRKQRPVYKKVTIILGPQ